MIICYDAQFPPCRPPFFLVRAAAAAAVEQKSCFDLAENFEAGSLWVGAHRYTRISCASKLLWVQSDLKSDFLFEKKLLKYIQHLRESLKITQDLGTHCPGCSQEYDIIIFHLSKLLWDNHSIEKFFHFKKKFTSILEVS